jgi:hypothetical protein
MMKMSRIYSPLSLYFRRKTMREFVDLFNIKESHHIVMKMSRIYSPLSLYFRRKRMRKFVDLFSVKDSDHIIDVGGYPFNWTLIDIKPKILMVNLEDETWEEGNLKKVMGDGRSLEFNDNSFDIAYSNSVIEHVGCYGDQLAFAREISRVGYRYYVQTPNRWFFVEPHLLTVFITYLPRSILRKLVRYCSVWGLIMKPTQEQVDDFLGGLCLLDYSEMRKLFPDAEILRERFFGITKSLIATRTQPPGQGNKVLRH